MKKYWIAFASLFILVAYQNCSDVNLSDRRASVSVLTEHLGIEYCSDKSLQIRTKLKFIFVVDRSGSNEEEIIFNDNGDPIHTRPGTDPGPATIPTFVRNRRFDSINNFVNDYEESEDIYWSFVEFGDAEDTEVPVGEDADEPENVFNNDKDLFINEIVEVRRNEDVDNQATNYSRAIAKIFDVISDDIEFEREQPEIISSSYVIFYLSDGVPRVNGQLQDNGDLVNGVEGILDLKDSNPNFVDRIQFNTLYYFNPFDPVSDAGFENEIRDLQQQASALLEEMAIEGEGSFIQVSAGQNIDFNQFQIPERVQRFNFRNIWIDNESVLWKENRLLVDSDEDLLADEDELFFGSDPDRIDSDNNGVRDGIEMILSGKPCLDDACDPARAAPYNQLGGDCANLEGADTASFRDKDNDGLNDCEEKLLGSDIEDFDSNSDSVPDYLAVRYGMPFLKGSGNILDIDSDLDSLTNRQELERQSPLFFNNSQIPGLELMSVAATQEVRSPLETCYNYRVTNMPISKTENQVRVYAIEDSLTVTNKKILRTAVKIFGPGAMSIRADEFE